MLLEPLQLSVELDKLSPQKSQFPLGQAQAPSPLIQEFDSEQLWGVELVAVELVAVELWAVDLSLLFSGRRCLLSGRRYAPAWPGLL